MNFENFLKDEQKIIDNYESFVFIDGYIPVGKIDDDYVVIHQSLVDNDVYKMTEHVTTDSNQGNLVFMFKSRETINYVTFGNRNNTDDYDVDVIDRFIELLNIPLPTPEQLDTLASAEIEDDFEWE